MFHSVDLESLKILLFTVIEDLAVKCCNYHKKFNAFHKKKQETIKSAVRLCLQVLQIFTCCITCVLDQAKRTYSRLCQCHLGQRLHFPLIA